MNTRSLAVTAALYAEATRDLADTADALEKARAELVQAQSLLKGSDEKKAELERERDVAQANLARLRNPPQAGKIKSLAKQ